MQAYIKVGNVAHMKVLLESHVQGFQKVCDITLAESVQNSLLQGGALCFSNGWPLYYTWGGLRRIVGLSWICGSQWNSSCLDERSLEMEGEWLDWIVKVLCFSNGTCNIIKYKFSIAWYVQNHRFTMERLLMVDRRRHLVSHTWSRTMFLQSVETK